jgi:hypothetical protein
MDSFHFARPRSLLFEVTSQTHHSFAKDELHRLVSCRIPDADISEEVAVIKTMKFSAALAALLLTASPTLAGSCEHAIARVQSQVDAAIEEDANSGGWKPESLDALRGHQPTPRSLTQAEGHRSLNLELALDALGRARAADRSGYDAACRRQLSRARFIIRQQRP